MKPFTVVDSYSSMELPIPAHNVGFRLLMKMGWKEHTGLGRKSEGTYWLSNTIS
jgi:hypothetical protein